MNRTHYFVRHGRSAANAGLRTMDETLVNLAPEGYEQARTAETSLRGKVRRIISSKYPRALQTAAPLAESSGLTPEIWPIHEFFYLNPELCRNTNQRERGKMRAEFWGMLEPEWRHCPQSESFCDLLARIEAFRQRMLALPDDTAIFGHGQFGMVFLITLHYPEHSPRQIMELTHRIMYAERRNIPNGGILRFVCNDDGLVSFPDVCREVYH